MLLITRSCKIYSRFGFLFFDVLMYTCTHIQAYVGECVNGRQCRQGPALYLNISGFFFFTYMIGVRYLALQYHSVTIFDDHSVCIYLLILLNNIVCFLTLSDYYQISQTSTSFGKKRFNCKKEFQNPPVTVFRLCTFVSWWSALQLWL